MTQPLLYLLLLLLLTPALGFYISVGRVLEDGPEDGRIVRVQYWRQFRVFMDKLDAANFNDRADMLTSPAVSDSLVPPELLTAISTHLHDDPWMDRLEAEYITDGEHNMTLLIDTLQELGDVAEKHQESVPREVLKVLLWRGLVRPERQHVVEARLGDALRRFFDTPQAVRLQREEPELFEEYLLGVFEFDWMAISEVLQDTLSHYHLRTQLAAEAGRSGSRGRVHRQQPPEDPTEGSREGPLGQEWHEFIAEQLDDHDEEESGELVAGATAEERHIIIDDGRGPPAWDGRVQEADAELLDGEGGWTDGQFVWMEAKEGGNDDVGMLDSTWRSDDGIDKNVREAHHHKPEEADVEAGTELFQASAFEGVGESVDDSKMSAEDPEIPDDWPEDTPDSDWDNLVEDEQVVTPVEGGARLPDGEEPSPSTDTSVDGEWSEENGDFDGEDLFVELEDSSEGEEEDSEEDVSCDDVEGFGAEVEEPGKRRDKRHHMKHGHKNDPSHHENHGKHPEHAEHHERKPSEHQDNADHHTDTLGQGINAAHHGDENDHEQCAEHAQETGKAAEEAVQD